MIGVFLTILIIFGSIQASIAQEDAFIECAQEPIDALRLSCYDGFAAKAARETAAASSLVTPSSVDANDGTRTERSEDAISRDPHLWLLSKLSSDDPNFFAYSTDPSSDNRGAQDHLEFEISVKYPLWEWGESSKLYFIYNGAYDFQALSDAAIYDSSPIISTTQNPGVAFEWDAGSSKEKFRIGVFHHSNGQTLNDSLGEQEFGTSDEPPWHSVEAVEEFERIRNRWNESPALERVSRSSWYTQFRYQAMSNPGGIIANDWWQYQLEIRPWYFKNDDRVFWPPVPRNQPQIENFDGLRAVGERMFELSELPVLRRSQTWQNITAFFPGRFLGRAEVQTGLWSPFENVGGQLSLGYNIDNFILSTYYYSGFAKDISSYHKRTKHFGIGLELR